MPKKNPYKLDQVGIRMVKEPPHYSAEPVNSPQAAVRLMSQTLKGYDCEVLAVVNLRFVCGVIRSRSGLWNDQTTQG